MLRNLIILILIMVALAVVRWLVTDVLRAVKRSLAGDSGEASQRSAGKRGETNSAKGGRHLVRDPISGTYIDERLAVKATIDGKTYYFESRENRDAFVRKSPAGA